MSSDKSGAGYGNHGGDESFDRKPANDDKSTATKPNDGEPAGNGAPRGSEGDSAG